MQPADASFFDPKAQFTVSGTRLNHWDQPGAFAFVTFRLRGSLPADAVKQWYRQRAMILREHGIALTETEIAQSQQQKSPEATKVNGPELSPSLTTHLSPRALSILKWKLFQAWDEELDGLHGTCCLRDRRCSKIVSDGLLRFDKDRYLMAAYSIMPNHVHLLAAFESEGKMVAQGADWRRYFAREINTLLRRSGHLWQQDQFDHLVRSPESFERIRRYILENPFHARSPSGEYRIYVSPEW
jgi:type I restriction enzyme R subunit